MKKMFQINYFRKFIFIAGDRSFATLLRNAMTCREKAAIPLIHRPAGIIPDFYTEIGSQFSNTTKPDAKG
ncbi:hypothetical protein [Serratia symbiotica]|uniref:Uncharacterized protein n=1 Tax=Serratia symbiotica TaxID=138074 RepID=A0A7D5NNX4_9GAMM|nr:hypothetical protein [Serratia symbiotica]MBF1994866.1 hypothetical protein [Serratia symbiotica]MBQ0955020.1 hypothetical protein [Serratia symbiotica]QLH64022.1 hypothetical protein SYMBAF_15235 [Serratia symbiotica]QTP14428.1 hypothetical protein GPZ83_0014050 [Serratia symbiotica]